jgi:hypothetical protein
MSDSPKADPSVAYENLRRESCALLGLDPDGAPTPLEQMQTDLTGIVRMTIDAIQGDLLAGREADVGRLATCVALLGKLLPQKLEAEAKHDLPSDARERLAQLIDNQATAAAYDDEHRWAEASEVEAEVEAAAMLPPAPALPGPPVPARATYIDAAVVDPVPPPPTPTPPQPSSDAEWARWYRSGGDTGRGVHSIPKDF